MGVLSMSGSVRRAFGERTAAAMDAGVGLPADGQCWQCGDPINFLAASPGSITLSAVLVARGVTISAWGHKPHAPSRVFTSEEFKAVASTKKSAASSDAWSDSALIVDGQQLL